ncbi:hypothetical protein [Candidatus Tisiphia endosymbiont of Dioctria rufipes]|uniref:hypothetical protein n=1 Tax=Candidatus Tisiphia endosymbiont of Dioctria rufipes TaxID=3066255 RepID=UPI00312C88A4
MTNSTTQFLDLMKSFMNPEVYMNSVKNLPVMDFSAMSDTIKKSTKILTTINQIVTESLQSMIQKKFRGFSEQCYEYAEFCKRCNSFWRFKPNNRMSAKIP